MKYMKICADCDGYGVCDCYGDVTNCSVCGGGGLVRGQSPWLDGEEPSVILVPGGWGRKVRHFGVQCGVWALSYWQGDDCGRVIGNPRVYHVPSGCSLAALDSRRLYAALTSEMPEWGKELTIETMGPAEKAILLGIYHRIEGQP